MESFQKRDRDRRKRQKRLDKADRRRERAEAKKQPLPQVTTDVPDSASPRTDLTNPDRKPNVGEHEGTPRS